MEYAVYTPPNWQPGERLPLVVFLHGINGSHENFEQYGAHTYLDEKIFAGKIKRAIIVLPNGGNGLWENWHDGTHHYRDWVLQHLVPRVQQDYQTLGCPQHCHLGGISVGGFGALRFAYFAKSQFSSVSAISAPIFSDQKASGEKASRLVRLFIPFERIFGSGPDDTYRASNPYNAWVDDPQQRKMRLQLMWGDNDKGKIAELNQSFHAHLLENNVEHDYFIYSGRHKWKYWIKNFDRMFNFLLDESELKPSVTHK